MTLVLVGILSSLFFPSAFAQESETFAVALVERITDSRTEMLEGRATTVQQLQLSIEEGIYAGKTYTVEYDARADQPEMLMKAGDRVTVEFITFSDGSTEPQLRERYRLPNIGFLTLLFVALAVLLGGWTGVFSIAGLGISVAVLLFFIIPRIVQGDDPLFISVIGCIVIACFSLFIAHGFRRRTSVALFATILTLLCALLLAVVFVHVASLFGMGSEESFYLQIGQLQDVDLRGLLLGGMLLGALGVLDDITTAQCAVVDEVSKANPSLSSKELRSAGASVGREHIASLINTLALAYAGASLPLLLLLDVNSDFPLWVTLNSEFLAEEIVRTLVGSMALLLAVPISTWLASIFLKAKPGSHPVTHSHAHGHHH